MVLNPLDGSFQGEEPMPSPVRSFRNPANINMERGGRYLDDSSSNITSVFHQPSTVTNPSDPLPPNAFNSLAEQVRIMNEMFNRVTEELRTPGRREAEAPYPGDADLLELQPTNLRNPSPYFAAPPNVVSSTSYRNPDFLTANPPYYYQITC